MDTAAEKIARNNLDCLSEYVDALRIVRENGGYGAVETKVKDGKVLVVRAVVEKHIK